MIKASTIRQRFLEYFGERGHQVVRSSSIVPANDPTLYFTNAGMVQFKDVFTGEETRPYSRACSSQKCLRVSGKHNDLETVGRTPKHHTFFEMLGNFSFGDYFKREAIHFAWEFLTEHVGLDADRLVATVFRGEEGVPADDEAFAVWVDEIGLPPARVLRLDAADNFWSMGDTGPCGPCSELHLMPDREVSMKEALAAGGPATDERWVEAWNLVFMQFNRLRDGSLVPLSRTGVDTGAGLERLTALVNGVPSTYEIDLLRPLIDHVAEMAGCRYGSATTTDVSLRVIADHARASAFCIADGVFPEKGGREYVLRRIMRRAIRHGKLLGFEEPFFHRVCLEVTRVMGGAFPELVERAELIDKLAQAEEVSFRRTLDRGLETLQQRIAAARQQGERELPPAFVGDLYATDGFPVDLTRLIADEAGLAVDEEAAHRWVVETHGAGETKVGEKAVAAVYKQLAAQLGPSEFAGYERESLVSRVTALLLDGEQAEEATGPAELELVSAETPFYGRSGGQVGDVGEIVVRGAEVRLEVVDTIRPGGLIVHRCRLERGRVRRGDEVELRVAGERRQAIRSNHSATHLLHHALRAVLGPHVTQKGSEVSPQQLRFDFSHFAALAADELRRVERLVNAEIRRDRPSRTEVTTFEQARRAGAMALFGERYGEAVRMVRIGSESVELCGGTHVARAGEIGLFRIVGEEALALGVRRIVALTGEAALAHDQQQQALLQAAAAALKVGGEELPERIERLVAQLRQRDREIAELKRRLATGGGTDLLDRVTTVGDIKVLAARVDAGDPKTLREAGDNLRDRLGSGVVVLGGEHQGKATLLAMVTKDLAGRVHAGDLVRELAKTLGGRGGGRPDMAQAGGPEIHKLDDALGRVPGLVEDS